MFLSSLVKTQSKPSALSTNMLTKPKNKLNTLIKLQFKSVSRSITSRENREKYDLKKMDDYWDSVEKEFNRRKEILKQVEEKYKTKYENLISASQKTASSSNETKEIYFVPLTKTDEQILKSFFKAEVHEDIRKGGRLVLLDEVRKYNKKQISSESKIQMDFEPLDAQDFEKLKRHFNFLLSEKEFFVVALQQGKKIFAFLEVFAAHRSNLLENLNAAFRRVEHLEAIEISHPLRNNLNVSLRKIENSKWIQNLFLKNKVSEKLLSEKFDKIYFEFLDCLNSAAAASRGYDIELFEDAAELKKALEIAKKNVKEKLSKISVYLDSVDFVDGKIVAVSVAAAASENSDNDIKNNKKFDAVRKGKDAEAKVIDNNKIVGNKKIEKNENNNDDNKDGAVNSNSNGNVSVNNQEENNADLEIDEQGKQYLFDAEKDYSNVFEKSEKDLTFDEYEYLRFYRDEALEEEYALMNSSYTGRLLLKLLKAEQALSQAAQVLEKNSTLFVYATENLIKASEIDSIINELKAQTQKTILSNDSNKFIFNAQAKKLDLQNEENFLKLSDNPKAYLQNLYWDLIKSAAADQELKIPESAGNDKESYLLKVLLKYFADVVQSKSQQFNSKDSRLEYFGENIKSYKLFENASKLNIVNNNNINEELNISDEEKANPETFFTTNFKKLVDYLNSQHGLIEKTVFDFKNNVESEGYSYPLNVVDLSEFLPVNDALGKEVLRFYVENSADSKSLLNEKDQEKVLKYVVKYLAEVRKDLQENYSENAEDEQHSTASLSKYKPSSYYSNLLESNFYNRIEAYSEKAAKSNLFLKALKSSDLQKLKQFSLKSKSEELEQQHQPKGEIIESLLVKGVFADRLLNNRPDAYLLMDNQDSLGLKYYMHKSLKGGNDYNLEDAYLTSFNDDTIAGDLNDEKIKLVKTRDNKIVLRVYYQISDASRLILLDSKSKDLLNAENNSSSNSNNNPSKINKHFLVFENELKSPSSLALLNKDFESWLASHEIEMGNWKLVDADNFMKGNSFFNNKTTLEAQLTAGANSLEELGAALNGYFHEENLISFTNDSAETPANSNAAVIADQPEKEKEKSKKNSAAAASNKDKEKEKNKKDSKEPKANKEKEGAKSKKGDKAEKAEKAAEEKPAAQKLTQLHFNYKVNYLFDLKDSQEMKKCAEDAAKISELIQSEIQKIRLGQAAVRKKDFVELEKKTHEKTQVFYDRLMEYIETENQTADLENEDLISLMESKDVSKELKKGLEEVTTKKNQLLKGLIESYKQLNEMTSKVPVESKKSRKIQSFEVELEEETEEKQAEKPQSAAKAAAVVSDEEKIQKMIASHMNSLFKKYDIEKIMSANRIKI